MAQGEERGMTIRRAFLEWLARWMEHQNNSVCLPDGTYLRRMSADFAAWTRTEGWLRYMDERDRSGWIEG